jgi:hypothetical protein
MREVLGIAERVRRECIEAAVAAYEDAGVRGLCAEGRWESAVSAMRALDVGGVAGAGTEPPRAPAAPGSSRRRRGR